MVPIVFAARDGEDCLVEKQRVRPQLGYFYGSWITDEIVGPWKGEPGTESWWQATLLRS